MKLLSFVPILMGVHCHGDKQSAGIISGKVHLQFLARNYCPGWKHEGKMDIDNPGKNLAFMASW